MGIDDPIIGTDGAVQAAAARAEGLLRVSGILSSQRPDHQPTEMRHAAVTRWYDRFMYRLQEWTNATDQSDRARRRMSMGTCLSAMERETVSSACSAMDTTSTDAGLRKVNEMIETGRPCVRPVIDPNDEVMATALDWVRRGMIYNTTIAGTQYTHVGKDSVHGIDVDGIWDAMSDDLYVLPGPDGRATLTCWGEQRLAAYKADLTDPQSNNVRETQ